MPFEQARASKTPPSPLVPGQYWLYFDQSQRRALVVDSSFATEGQRLEQEHIQEIPQLNVSCVEVVSRVQSAEYWQQPSLPALCQIIRRHGITIQDELSLPVSAQLVGRDVPYGLWLHVKVGQKAES